MDDFQMLSLVIGIVSLVFAAFVAGAHLGRK